MQKSDLITRKEVSSILKVSESNRYTLGQSQTFHSTLCSWTKQTVWSKTAVMAWLEKQKDNIVDWVE